MTTSSHTPKSWGKLKKFFVGLGISLLILFLLFCIFIANPFESDYPDSLFSLVSEDWDFAINIPNPKTLPQHFQSLPKWSKVFTNPSWPQLIQTQTFKDIQTAILDAEKQRRKFEKDSGITLETVLEHTLEKEILFAGKAKFYNVERLERFNPEKNVDVLFATRISFLIRVLYGIIDCLPSSLQNKVGIYSTPEGFLEIRDRHQSSFIWRKQDVFFFTNQKRVLTNVEKIISGTISKNLTSNYPSLSSKTSKPKVDIVGIVSAKSIVQSIKDEKLTENAIKNNIPINNIPLENVIFSIKMEPQKFNIQFDITCTSEFANETQEYLSATKQPKLWPENLVGYTSTSISWQKAWQSLKKSISPQFRPNFDKCMLELNRYYQTTDFAEEWLKKNLETEVLLTIGKTNFAKEKVTPYDLYPNINIIIPIVHKDKVLSELSEFLIKLTPIILGKEAVENGMSLFTQEKYARKDYLRIKWPDNTGGAIRPIIGVVSDYLVISTHEGFFKDWLDAIDFIEPAKSNPFPLVTPRSTHQLSITNLFPIGLYVDGNNLGEVVKQNSKIISHLLSEKGIDFEKQRKRIERIMLEYVLFLQVFSPTLLIFSEQQENTIQINLSLDL